jgi:hypothetical protein
LPPRDFSETNFMIVAPLCASAHKAAGSVSG